MYYKFIILMEFTVVGRETPPEVGVFWLLDLGIISCHPALLSALRMNAEISWQLTPTYLCTVSRLFLMPTVSKW